MNRFLRTPSSSRAAMDAFLSACESLPTPDEFPPEKLPHTHALDHMFFCESCKELLDAPRVLRCGHTFCYKCVQSLLNSTHAMASKHKNRDANRC